MTRENRRERLPRRGFEARACGQADKANDLLVARRQKNQGLHWREETSVALMRLRTLSLTNDWDRYWQRCQAPSLLAA